MNTLRKMRKNAKALSPVVASIILIAVTVAVSIAVAAWMGALVVGNMNTEEIKITNVYFASGTSATLSIKNTGTSPVVITEAYIGTNTATAAALPITLQPNTAANLDVTGVYAQGQSYQFKIVSSKGNPYIYTATDPLI
jgi:archaeal type IV pilus assembly protein PilA